MKTVRNAFCEVLFHSCVLQLVFKECQLDGIDSSGEIKEHDPHGAPQLLHLRESSMERGDDGVIHSHKWLIRKLYWVHGQAQQWSQVGKDQPFQPVVCSS